MKNSFLFGIVFVCIFILTACDGGVPSEVPPADVAPIEAVIPGKGTITPVVPVGGSESKPVFTYAASCPSFGNAVFDIRYSPVTLNISSVTSPATRPEFFPCVKVENGHYNCSTVIDPLATREIPIQVCYGAGIPHCVTSALSQPGCPAFNESFDLLNVTCLSNSKVRFTIDYKYPYLGLNAVCVGSRECGTTTTRYEFTEDQVLYSNQVNYQGDIPPVAGPLSVCTYFRGENMDVVDPHCQVFPEFISLITESCRQVIHLPTATQVHITVIPTLIPTLLPTARPCLSFTSDTECKKAGCYFWYTEKVCKVQPEPTTEPTITPPPFDCHQYDKSSEICSKEPACVYDKDKSVCNNK